jgi:hypothetical protein
VGGALTGIFCTSALRRVLSPLLGASPAAKALARRSFDSTAGGVLKSTFVTPWASSSSAAAIGAEDSGRDAARESSNTSPRHAPNNSRKNEQANTAHAANNQRETAFASSAGVG